MELRRRGFLGFLGLAPLAGPAAAQSLAEQNATNALRGMGWAFGGVPGPNPSSAPDWMRSGLGRVLWNAVNAERDQRQQRFERSLAYRYGALDLDIAAMKSWSRSYANSRQRMRDETELEWLRGAQNKLWPRGDE